MAFYVYVDAAYQWRWHLNAANNRKIADSGEAYHNEQDCLHAIGLLMDAGRGTPVYRK